MTEPTYRDMGLATAGELKRRNGGALLPVGSFEPHGTHLPFCTDAYIAMAFARLIGARCSCAVLPPVCYTPAETTHLLRPTISVRSGAFIPYLKNVCEEILRHGFDPLALISVHKGNEPALTIVIQELLRERSSMIAYYDPLALGMRTCAADIAPDADAFTWETSLLCGSLDLLGLSGAFNPAWASLEAAAEEPGARSKEERTAAYVGHAYEDLSRHIPLRAPLPPHLVARFMEFVADAIAVACQKGKS